MASVVGLADLKQEERNPWNTTTLGVGELMREVAGLGVDLILLGIGGSSTMMPVWGPCLLSVYDSLIRMAGELKSLVPPRGIRSQELRRMNDHFASRRDCLRREESVVGAEGATHQFGPQKGLPENELADLEAAVTDMLAKLVQNFPPLEKFRNARDRSRRWHRLWPFTELRDLSQTRILSVDHWFGLEEQIGKSDLILTGEGRFDRTSMSGKGPFEVIRLAHRYKRKCLVLAGSVEEEARRECIDRFPFCSIRPLGGGDLTRGKLLTGALLVQVQT